MSSSYKVHLSDDQVYDVAIDKDGNYLLNGATFDLDIARTGPDSWNVLHQHRSYNVQLISFDKRSKKLTLSVNDEVIDLQINTHLDELLSKMGMNTDTVSRMTDVKAPMPGLVLKVLVEAGSPVGAGDPLIILEAMKMENVIKATGAGVVAKILVNNQDAVEKNQVLIEME